MSIRVVGQQLDHTGGTKFYEGIYFENSKTRECVLVFRWGKVSERDSGGGQTKIEIASLATVSDLYRKKIQEKEKRGYSDARRGIGFGNRIDPDVLRLELNKHYTDAKTVETIMNGLGVTDVLTGSVGDTILNDDIIVEEPAPEIERGGDWASW